MLFMTSYRDFDHSQVWRSNTTHVSLWCLSWQLSFCTIAVSVHYAEAEEELELQQPLAGCSTSQGDGVQTAALSCLRAPPLNHSPTSPYCLLAGRLSDCSFLTLSLLCSFVLSSWTETPCSWVCRSKSLTMPRPIRLVCVCVRVCGSQGPFSWLLIALWDFLNWTTCKTKVLLHLASFTQVEMLTCLNATKNRCMPDVH